MQNKENTPKAIVLMLLGMSVFAMQDALIKIISEEANLFLIYFAVLPVDIIFILYFLNNLQIFSILFLL
mgnify:CR=1 FL=1